MGQLDKYKHDFKLLLEGGFFAANQADEDAAKKCFSAAQALQPSNTMPKVGFGYIHLLKLELKQACGIFEEIISKEPSNEMARALLGLSFALTTKDVSKGEKLLLEAEKNSSESTVKQMTKTAIDFIDRFIKKAPTPAQGNAAAPGKKKEKGSK